MIMKKRISIIGCGAIGTEVGLAIKERFNGVAELVAVCELSDERKTLFERALSCQVPSKSLIECVEASDFVIECAEAQIVPQLLKQAAMLKRDVMVLSVGGVFYEPQILEEVQSQGIRVYIPSGAIGGIDLLKAANVGKIYSVEIMTKKPIEALQGAPYLKQANIDLDSILGEKIIFEGKAVDAVKAFPKNVNVAATLSLAGIGPERTRVRIATSRTLKKNIHEIVIEGEFGRAVFTIENEPSRKNPKTSQLATFSAIAMLDEIFRGVVIGT